MAVGRDAGRTAVSANANVTGSQNVWIGNNSGPGTTTQLSNAIGIGYGALNTASNQAVLGNTSITQTLLNGNVGIGTTGPNALLHLDKGTGVGQITVDG